jgi:hypothetical protein
MKKRFLLTSMFMSALFVTTACDPDDDTPPVVDPGSNIIELVGNLETVQQLNLTKDKKYLIKGQVFVRSGKTLNIQAGTVIFGDKATKGTLIIDKGGKIEAIGTASEPIVMTSAQPVGTRDRGYWGGLVVIGNAPVNQPDPAIEGISPAVIFGGTNDNDNSGTLKYLRVEFAGIELTPNNETNSITLGGVGKGTTMEYCQVSYGGDDGFEWFGGSVNGKYLISFASWDDSFDVDFGYTGLNQFGLEVRYPSYADQSGSNSFECDNGPNDNVTSLLTTGVFTNFTCVGPRTTNTQSINANYQHSLDLRRRTAVTIANSVFIGYPRGLRMNQQSVYDNYNANTGVLTNNVMVAPTTTYTGSGVSTADVQAYWESNNETITSTDLPAQYAALGLNPNIAFGSNVTTGYASNPSFAVTSGALTSGASFTNPKLSNAFFTATSYRGAFGSTDWTDGWAEFQPIGKVY